MVPCSASESGGSVATSYQIICLRSLKTLLLLHGSVHFFTTSNKQALLLPRYGRSTTRHSRQCIWQLKVHQKATLSHTVFPYLLSLISSSLFSLPFSLSLSLSLSLSSLLSLSLKPYPSRETEKKKKERPTETMTASSSDLPKISTPQQVITTFNRILVRQATSTEAAARSPSKCGLGKEAKYAQGEG